MQHVEVHRIACSGASNVSAVQALTDSGAHHAADTVVVMGKTEGNSCANDFTRNFAATSWCQFLSIDLKCSPREGDQRLALAMSDGTKGVLSPHFGM